MPGRERGLCAQARASGRSGPLRRLRPPRWGGAAAVARVFLSLREAAPQCTRAGVLRAVVHARARVRRAPCPRAKGGVAQHATETRTNKTFVRLNARVSVSCEGWLTAQLRPALTRLPSSSVRSSVARVSADDDDDDDDDDDTRAPATWKMRRRSMDAQAAKRAGGGKQTIVPIEPERARYQEHQQVPCAYSHILHTHTHTYIY